MDSQTRREYQNSTSVSCTPARLLFQLPTPLPPVHCSLMPEILLIKKKILSLEVNVIKKQILSKPVRQSEWFVRERRLEHVLFRKFEGAGKVLFGKMNLETLMREKRMQD